MSYHTPGPWKVGWLETYDAMTGEARRFVYRSDAETAQTRIRVESGGGLFDCDADAALIAAAPDLLEALKLCVAWMPCAEVRSWPPGFRLRDEALAAARAAITKAEGK